MTRVILEGAVFDERTAYMLLEVRHRLDGIPFEWGQGSYSTAVGASGGTHAGGGAVDIKVAGREQYASLYETVMRSVGFAAWHRLPIPGVWGEHVHGIAIGCSDLSAAARSQVIDYAEGRNGLVGGARDTGSRDYVDVTWETYDPPAESIARAVWGK